MSDIQRDDSQSDRQTKDIQRVAVIGAGVMGSGIAAHIANAGVEVLLLDIVPEGAERRNQQAEEALKRLLKSKPAAYTVKKQARFITAGNLEDDLDKLRDCDWIIEAVVEKLSIKQDLYRQIEAYRQGNTIVSSNTSTLPLQQLLEGMSAEFRQHFLITHFFNPPRYMPLLEMVSSADTDPALEERIREFADIRLGKSPVSCKDTPGFIANRIGTYWLQAAVTLAIKRGIGVEEADAVLGRPVGVPKTGVFGLIDLVGLDLMPDLFQSFDEALPAEDPFRQLGPMPDLITRLIDDGYTGRKGKGGFYRLNEQGEKEAINLQDGSYSKAQRPKVAAASAAKKRGLRALLTHDSEVGRYARDVLLGTLHYATSLLPEIADNIEQVDRAMRLGFNWKQGPFELIDALGCDWFIAQLEAADMSVPQMLRLAEGRSFYRVSNGRLQYLDIEGNYQDVQRPAGVLLLEDVKRRGPRLFGNSQASVWDIGDGVACLEFHSKMNSLNPLIMHLLRKSLKRLPQQGFKGLVIANEGSNFSVGANLLMLLVAARLHAGFAIRAILRQGQFTLRDMKYTDFPVVGAPAGMALGGGCEILLHCDGIEAHAESYIGLVETGVGIVPGWGGCKELLLRGLHAGTEKNGKLKKGPMPALTHAFETIALAKVSTSAAEARELLFLRDNDGIVMNRQRVLAAGKARVLALAANYTAPQPTTLHLPGLSGQAALDLGLANYVKLGVASEHDAVIAAELGRVLSGGDGDLLDEVNEDQLLELERNALVSLSKKQRSKARISHMLFKGKPLRN